MGKMSRQQSSRNELSQEQVAWLIFGEHLLSGVPNPFGSDVAAEQAWLQNEQELIKAFALRYPARRPIVFWKHHQRQAVGSAAWLRPDGRVRISPVLESDAQFLWRTQTFLPHEKVDVERKAIADTLEQQRRIENTKAWAQAGEGSRLPRVLKEDKEPVGGLSHPGMQ